MSAIGKTVLVIAAHPDDEALGCGGSMARWAAEGRTVHLLLLADGEGARGDVAGAVEFAAQMKQRRLAAEAAADILGVASATLLDFADNRMDGVELLDVVKAVERIVAAVQPESVLTHHAGDVNVDHRIAHDAVLTACRPQPGYCVRQLLFFEVPSSTEWRPTGSAPQFVPNFFVDITGTLEVKQRALQAYRDEMRPFPHPRSLEAIEALARWRGASCGVAAAEAFVLGRQLI
ncbi:MAG TPA: PIG-L family deacetylase [Sedimenticola sp.]|nr:PIG-L family deacetylase [Sedimenticola sp.]